MLKPNDRLTWVRLLCVAILVLGIVFRWANLDRKIYWHDEVFTSLHITGHSRSELVERAFRGEEVTVQDLQAFQRLDPSRGVGLTVQILGAEDSQHPPLYYVLAKAWAQWFGDSATAIRSFSALTSLLTFPLLYWLCLELFECPLTGWVAIALIAVSPFHVLYAQEAREYSLWTATVLLCSIALFRAMNVPTIRNWGFYAISLILSFYTFLLTALFAVGHALYVLINTGFSLNRRSVSYLVSSAIALVVLSPWMYFIRTYADTVKGSTAWTTQSLTLPTMANMWAFNVSRLIVDFDFSLDDLRAYFFIVPVLLLEGYALYYLCRRTSSRVWLFVLCLTFSSFVALLLPDLVLGGQRSTVTRYLIPSHLGIHLALAYLLTQRLRTTNLMRLRLWGAIAAITVLAGIASCAVSAQADTWWNKVVGYTNPEMARIINASDRPLVISDAFGVNPANVVSLSYVLNPQTRFLLLSEVGESFNVPPIDLNANTVFLLNLPEVFRTQFEQNYQASLTPIVGDLWQVNR
ncbi:glycosyltransferase family 39 protein [Oculatella sp. LEGE 06141]|uniref:glycosyltransferase family 39 protein n=1 Tax=Oculatella sp. LEGE 06141 TaxID=1828648 RepID=UPI001881C5B5|nr:glycosyltransferase family 39 protein [Oculatella sp. LEGE 06141]MBE9178215.1 glycosyltransferase family 39 protein [Oculatella sp. LEGE 06141]